MMMMMVIETAAAVCFPASSSSSSSSSSVPHYWPLWKKSRGINGWSLSRRGGSVLKSGIRACTEHLGSASDPSKQKGSLKYHPFEEISDSSAESSGDATLTPQETARTIVELNGKATLVLTGVINDEIHENIIWPDLPYVTDEHGNVYFQVKNDEDILQTLTSENNIVQAIIGFDATEMIAEMELLGPSEIDFGIEEIEDQNGDIEDDDGEDEEDDDEYDEDFVTVLEDGDEETNSDESLGDWAKLETMRSSHPMYFAKRLAQVASDDPVDWMEQPSAGLAIQGLVRPALIEEHSDIQRHKSSKKSSFAEKDQEEVEERLDDGGMINGHKQETGSSEDSSIWAKEVEDNVPINGTSFYKLEMIKIQLISAPGHQTLVEIEDFRKAEPDPVALLAIKIISRLNASGEKLTQALKSLCWRCKGVQVEEAAIINVDSLGFDLRVCSGTQIQTLRFPFSSRATSEGSAERQLNDLLFSKIHHRLPRRKHTHRNEQ